MEARHRPAPCNLLWGLGWGFDHGLVLGTTRRLAPEPERPLLSTLGCSSKPHVGWCFRPALPAWTWRQWLRSRVVLGAAGALGCWFPARAGRRLMPRSWRKRLGGSAVPPLPSRPTYDGSMQRWKGFWRIKQLWRSWSKCWCVRGGGLSEQHSPHAAQKLTPPRNV